MKIAFMGASGTGKSTLARFVAETYNLPINPVGSRSTAKAMGFVGPDGEGRPYDVDEASALVYEDAMAQPNFDNPRVAAKMALKRGESLFEGETMRPTFQRKLAADKIAWETNEDAHPDGFVTDRTPLDDVAYAILHCREVVDGAFLDRAIAHTVTYDVVFFTSIASGQWLAKDPSRVSNPAYHRIFEGVVYGLAVGIPLRPWDVKPGDVTLRQHDVRGWIDSGRWK